MRGCLDDDEVLELVVGQHGCAALPAIELHVDACAACHDAVAAAVRLVGDEPDEDAPRVGGGRYHLVGAIGYAGSGSVYRARALAAGTCVAVKTAQLGADDMPAAIRREIHVPSRQRDPAIVRTIDHGV